LRIYPRHILPCILTIILLFTPISHAAAPGPIASVQPSAQVSTRLQFNDLSLEIPANAAKNPITVQQAGNALDGINLSGFIALGEPYAFGPDGLKFSTGKQLKARIRIDRNRLKGHPASAVRLYYINHATKQLEKVLGQSLDTATHTLEADITHFSDYVLGIKPLWAGDGLNLGLDYVHNGEEHVSVSGRSLTILSSLMHVKGRGLDIHLTRAYSSQIDTSDLFKISDGWYWALPHVESNQLFLSNGMKYDLQDDYPGTYIYDLGETAVKAVRTVVPYYTPGKLAMVYLQDGSKIEIFDDYQVLSDTNGNWLRYDFARISDTFGTSFRRIVSMTDSIGHTFYFNYNRYYHGIDLRSVEQLLDNGTRKAIVTRNLIDHTHETFVDALGRTTAYSYYPFSPDAPNIRNKYISQITYPNGLLSSYQLDDQKQITSQTFTKPGSTTPARRVTYTPAYYSPSFQTVIATTVHDGTAKKIYNFTYNNPLSTQTESPGYTKTEETYDLSGKLVKRVNTAYQYLRSQGGNLEFARPLKMDTTLAKADGTLGTTATYEYAYDNWTNTIMVKDPYGTITRMAYANTNSNGNLGVLSPGMQNYSFTTHPDYANIGYNKLLTKAVLVNDPVHNTTQLKQTHYLYTSVGNLKTEREVYGGSYLDTNYTYHAYGQLKSKKDANGNELWFEYDNKLAYLTRVYKPDGTTIATYQNNVNLGKPVTVTDPKGNIFRYAYDAIGRLTKETLDNPDSQVGVTRRITYNDAANMIRLDFGNEAANVWQKGRITYDPIFGKPVKVERSLNDGSWRTQKQFTYESNGNLATETDAMGHTAKHEYDALDREIKTTFPDKTVTAYAWDERKLTMIDGNGNQKFQKYDLLDRIVQVKEYPNSDTAYITNYTYDTESHLIRVTNPLGASTINTYDNLGRLTKVDYPQDSYGPGMVSEYYTYDNVGNLATKTLGTQNPKTMEYEFYAGYRVKKVTEPDGRVVEYGYDANDNILTQTCLGVSYTYSGYDARNRAHNFTAQIDGNTFNFSYNYDLYGRMTSIQYPNRTNPVTYNYDELDRLQSIPGFVNSMNYDLDGKITDMLFGNGVNNHYTYRSNDDKLANISVGPAGTLLNLNYSYDNLGNITQINNDYYSYDGLNRLKWAGDQPTKKIGNGTLWSYDGAGNRTNHTRYINSVMQESIDYTYDLANRLWSKGSTTYTNSNIGERLIKADDSVTWTYQYDGESRLIKALNNGTTISENTYDGSGMRIKKVESGKTVYYVYNGNNPIVEYSANEGIYSYYIYAGKQTIAEESNGVVKFYHKDHLGSTRIITDALGTKLAEYTYEPFGRVVIGADGEQSFTGKKQDETGLLYFGARFYDVEVGRFLTLDPIKSGNNWFIYCENNPLNYVDLLGLEKTTSSISQNSDGTSTTTYNYGNITTVVTEDKDGNEISRYYYMNGIANLSIINEKNLDGSTENKTYYDKKGNPLLRLVTEKNNKGQIYRETLFRWHVRSATEAAWINWTCKLSFGAILGLVCKTPWAAVIGSAFSTAGPTPFEVSTAGETYVTSTTYYPDPVYNWDPLYR
jgi:RHS repeat-associated protein